MALTQQTPDQQKVQPIPGIQPLPGVQPITAQMTPPSTAPSDANVPGIPPIAPAPPVMAPTSSAPPSVPTSTISSGNNLLSTQINPTAPTATAQASPQSDSQFQKYTQGFDTALSNISNGPNRTQM